jgi:hypothetical protein
MQNDHGWKRTGALGQHDIEVLTDGQRLIFDPLLLAQTCRARIRDREDSEEGERNS